MGLDLSRRNRTESLRFLVPSSMGHVSMGQRLPAMAFLDAGEMVSGRAQPDVRFSEFASPARAVYALLREPSPTARAGIAVAREAASRLGCPVIVVATIDLAGLEEGLPERLKEFAGLAPDLRLVYTLTPARTIDLINPHMPVVVARVNDAGEIRGLKEIDTLPADMDVSEASMIRIAEEGAEAMLRAPETN